MIISFGLFFIYLFSMFNINISNNPLVLSLGLIFFSLSSGAYFYSLFNTWQMYMIILIFLGGVMILFLYMSLLASNEKLYFYNVKVYPSFILLGLAMLVFPFSGNNHKMSVVDFFPSFMYSNFNESTLVFLILFLLLMMICIVKVVKMEVGPLNKRL